MSGDELHDEEPKKTKGTKKTASSESNRRAVAEAASGWSNDIDVDDDSVDGIHISATRPPMIGQSSRRATEENTPAGIPTISADEVEGDDPVDPPPPVAAAPQFSVYQIASFKEIEQEFTRQRPNQYIDSKIDTSILYNNLHLQEELNAENEKLWDWDKVFVEVRNSISSSTVDS